MEWAITGWNWHKTALDMLNQEANKEGSAGYIGGVTMPMLESL